MKKKTACCRWPILLALFLVFFNNTVTGVTMAAAGGIEGPEWQLTEVKGEPVSSLAGDRRPFLKFNAEKKQATGFAGCNNFFGNYEIVGPSLKFAPLGSTRMACPDLDTGLETEVFDALEKTRSWEIRNYELVLLDDQNVLARFMKEGIAEITGTVWEWVQTQYNDDKKTVPAEQANYTVQFFQDKSLSVKADCNQKGGSYSIEDKRLSIEITHSTMAACPDGSLEEDFVRELTAAAIYFFNEEDLFIDLKYDTGTMRFAKKNME